MPPVGETVAVHVDPSGILAIQGDTRDVKVGHHLENDVLVAVAES